MYWDSISGLVASGGLLVSIYSPVLDANSFLVSFLAHIMCLGISHKLNLGFHLSESTTVHVILQGSVCL